VASPLASHACTVGTLLCFYHSGDCIGNTHFFQLKTIKHILLATPAIQKSELKLTGYEAFRKYEMKRKLPTFVLAVAINEHSTNIHHSGKCKKTAAPSQN